MKLKWASLITLVFVLACCATTMSYNKAPWGSSKLPYFVSSIALERTSAHMDVYEIPSENQIQLRAGQLFVVSDRGGNLDGLREALNKYVEWKEQLKDTGGKISKPIGKIDLVYLAHATGQQPDLYSLMLSFETTQDGEYYLLATEMISRYLNGDYTKSTPTGVKVLLFENQVVALKEALSQENILAKAKEADDIANQKAEEQKQNQALQNSLQ